MFARLRMALAVWTAVCLAACQSAIPLGSGQPAGGSAGRATIAVRIATEGGMGVKALPKSPADVASYKIELIEAGPDRQPESDDEVAPVYSATIAVGDYANPHTIPNIGTGLYYLRVDAFDAKGDSIAQPDTRSSENGVEVAGGVAAYLPSGSELIVNLKLLNGTKGKGLASVTMTPPAHITPLTIYGASLVNRDYGDVAAMVSVAQSYEIKELQEGTFDIWAHARDLEATTPSKPKLTGITVSSEGVAVPSAITCTFVPAVFSTPAAGTTFTTALRPAIANDGSLYYVDGTAIKKLGDPGFSMATSIPSTAIAVSPDGATVYAADGPKIMRHDGTVMATAPSTVTALAVAPDGKIYYAVDDKTIRLVGEAATQSTADVATNLAVDRVGNIYYIEKTLASTDIRMKVNRPGYYFGQARSAGSDVKINSIGGADFTGLAVDRSGALYIADFGLNRIRMIGAGDPAMLRVAGTGTSGTDDAAADATKADITSPIGVAVSDTGTLYFASNNGSDFVVRKVE